MRRPHTVGIVALVAACASTTANISRCEAFAFVPTRVISPASAVFGRRGSRRWRRAWRSAKTVLFVPALSPSPSRAAASSSDEGGGKDEQSRTDLDMGALARRIESLAAAENSSSSAFEDGLRRRARDLAAGDELEASMASESSIIELPVLCFDAILPGQRLSGSSEDPTFSRLLVELGMGGAFVMTSLNHKQRKLRRSGTVCRVELVDVDRRAEGGPMEPTAVTFSVVGRRRCRVVGPSEGMVARVGRWRRMYDPDGEESRLGWGVENFVDMEPESPGVASNETSARDKVNVNSLKNTEWSLSAVDCGLEEAPIAESERDLLLARGRDVNALVDRWIQLASDPATYDNVDVVASTRRKRGEPGLRIDPSRLLRNIMSDLGPRPDPSNSGASNSMESSDTTMPLPAVANQPKTGPMEDLTNFAIWGAALMNPLPCLGVSPEVRGMMLEAIDSTRRLNILEWGLKRSISNLEGTSPL